MFIHDSDKICGNCANWAEQRYQSTSCIPQYATIKGYSVEVALCKVSAVEADAGEAVVLLSAKGNCLMHRQMWVPSDEYLDAEHCPPPPSQPATWEFGHVSGV